MGRRRIVSRKWCICGSPSGKAIIPRAVMSDNESGRAVRHNICYSNVSSGSAMRAQGSAVMVRLTGHRMWLSVYARGQQQSEVGGWDAVSDMKELDDEQMPKSG